MYVIVITIITVFITAIRSLPSWSRGWWPTLFVAIGYLTDVDIGGNIGYYNRALVNYAMFYIRDQYSIAAIHKPFVSSGIGPAHHCTRKRGRAVQIMAAFVCLWIWVKSVMILYIECIQRRTNYPAGPRLHSFYGPLLPFFVYAPLKTVGILMPLQCCVHKVWPDQSQWSAKWNVT